jgi:hypothetical protein
MEMGECNNGGNYLNEFKLIRVYDNKERERERERERESL